MSHISARHESQQVTNSLNLFVDSERAINTNGSSKGDDCEIHFEGHSIRCDDGEMLRMSLTDFAMINNLYHIDVNCSRFTVYNQGNSTTSDQHITRQNYRSIKDIADDFGTQVAQGIIAVAQNTVTLSAKVVTAPIEISMGDTGNRVLDVTLTFSGAHGITASELDIQTLASAGETYAVLGSLRLDPGTTLTNSFTVSAPSTTKIRIQGFFPMQRFADPYIYLRCDAANNGLEMSVLDSGRHAQREILPSNILGKMNRDVEFITYKSNGNREYFVNLQQKQLASLRLFLTDSKGNHIGRISSKTNDGTAAGREDSSDNFVSKLQSTLGNLFFTATIRIDTIRMFIPRELQSEPPPPPMPAHEAQSVLVWPNYGRPKY